MSGNAYTSGQVAKVTGLPYHTINYWVKTGLVVPSISAMGSGSCRGYTLTDIVAMDAAAALKHAGAGTDVLSKVITKLQKCEDVPSGSFLIVTSEAVKLVGKGDLAEQIKDASIVLEMGERVEALVARTNSLTMHNRGKAKLITDTPTPS